MVAKAFIFLYPQEEIFENEIDKGSVFFKDPREKEKEAYFMPKIQNAATKKKKGKIWEEARKDRAKAFKPVYSAKLNSCIDWRYRKNNFSINYVILADRQVSDIIKVSPTDRIIKVEIDSKTHGTKNEEGKYTYPDQNSILNQILPAEKLVVAGFHMWDCVENLARRAYERGLNVLVDEDLTEFFASRLKDNEFRVKTYPTHNSRLKEESHFEMFMKARKNKPWLWQEY